MQKKMNVISVKLFAERQGVLESITSRALYSIYPHAYDLGWWVPQYKKFPSQLTSESAEE